ncbi:hypothetical protein M3Y97_01164700 [Aphelenchoides bicaudatus]|nr:hypothetical protein M3Y97_01164700 [Aphelenchoides bicaudatus]
MVRSNKNLNGYRLFYRVKHEELETKGITDKDAAAAISRSWKAMHTHKKDSYKYEAAVKRAKTMKEPRPPKPDNYVSVLDKKPKTSVKKSKTA